MALQIGSRHFYHILMRNESIHKGHFVHVCKSQKSPLSLVWFLPLQSVPFSCPLFIGIRSNLSMPVTLYNEEVIPGNLFDGALKLSVKFFQRIFYLIR